MTDTRTDEKKAQDIVKMLGNLATIRNDYEDMIDDVLKFVNHSRRLIDDKEWKRGKKTGIDVYDGTAISALNLLTDGLCGYSVSKSFHWFDYTLPNKLNFPRISGMRAWSGKRLDEYPDVQLWLEDVEQVMYASFLRGNFYDVIPEIVRDAASIGTVSTFIEEDLASGRTMYIVPHFRECYIAEDQFGMVDTNLRVYNLTLKAFAEKFGLEKMKEADPSFEKAYEANPYAEKPVIHATYPRSTYDPNLLNAANKPWASMWILQSPLKLLLESGYDDMASITWRWRKNSDELYGRSPAWDCFVDIMKANQQAKSNLTAAQKMVDPPMIGTEDLRGKIRSLPGGWTWVMSTEKNYPKPMVTGIQLPFGIDQQERSDKSIRDHFHVDFFLLLSQAAMNKVELTATQVIEMSGEKAAILGVRIGRMESELLNPIHDRQFNIEFRAKRIPVPPQIVLDTVGAGHIEVDYLGPLAQAQKKMFRSQTIRAGIQSVGEISAIYPQARFVIDPVKATKDLLDAQGFPVKDFRSEEEINRIMAAELQKKEAIEKAELLPGVGKGIKALGSPVEPGSPLAAMEEAIPE